MGISIMKKPLYQLKQPQDIIRQFTPNWFAMVMGTGVVALILPEFANGHQYVWQFAQYLWLFNTLLFTLFSVLYLLRWIIYPTEAKQIFKHPSMSLFLGTIPMGLATIINGLLKFGLPLYGDLALNIAHFLWYVDVTLAVLIGIAVPFFMFSQQQHQLHSMTAMWLLPIVACEVAATSGGLLIHYLPADTQSLAILLGSYVLWGMSVLPAFAVLTILMLRLALHQLPAKELAITGWLALGPIGTGALALLVLGAEGAPLLQHFGLGQLGEFLHMAGLFSSFILLGFGLWWFAIAVLITRSHLRTDLPFNLGWWGLTFPLGVFTLAVLNLAQQSQIGFIHSIGLGFAMLLIGLWLLVMFKTLQGMYRGNLFFSPCLKSFLENHPVALKNAD
ncbi:C4-dicarboxylate transporter/malic acid transport protein [Acinetobacter calcoaceticus]|uniref:C4-dicarboxylate transporter/malic acid transport protein n=1 Tax=Acinetobacter calcoaceticus TaxID=471 RepID=A0A4R1XMT7_ACICA|nr:C4-dicarboxylate transporter/malic acid transport protein [Acinetobacter calcoaceticus]